MLKKLFESLDEKVFTSDLKEKIESQFNEAVELKAVELASQRIEEKIDELEEKAEEYKSLIEKESKEKEEELIEQIDGYLEKIVDDFVKEAKESLDESIKSEKADMIIESFDAMIVSTGAKIADIVEAREAKDPENKLSELSEKYDSVIDENLKLQKENNKLLKMGIISEMKEGLNLVEAEKFAKLADIVPFENSQDYLKKLDTIKESVIVKSEEKPEKKDLKETKETKEIKETKEQNQKDTILSSFSHLI